MNCAANLKAVGMAFRPDAVGRVEPTSERSVSADATRKGADQVERHFLNLAHELASPRYLVCPQDSRRPVKDLASLRCENLSYFLNLNLDGPPSAAPLAGDRDLTFEGRRISQALAPLHRNTRLEWIGELHSASNCGPAGNICLKDGSVRVFGNCGLRNLARRLDQPTNWLAMP
jgi:hypothetical protein